MTLELAQFYTRTAPDMKLSEAVKHLRPIAQQNGLKLHTASGWNKAVKLLDKSINQN